jgi:2-iminobutanoate/2-iminopropanoate deaminase
MTAPVHSATAPAPIGPYSQAIDLGSLVYCSGQTGVNPATGEIEVDGVIAETEQTFANIVAVLEAAGLGLANIIKTTVYLANMDDFTAMNEVYARHFSQPYPARSTVEVAALPKGALVEIEVLASR